MAIVYTNYAIFWYEGMQMRLSIYIYICIYVYVYIPVRFSQENIFGDPCHFLFAISILS